MFVDSGNEAIPGTFKYFLSFGLGGKYQILSSQKALLRSQVSGLKDQVDFLVFFDFAKSRRHQICDSSSDLCSLAFTVCRFSLLLSWSHTLNSACCHSSLQHPNLLLMWFKLVILPGSNHRACSQLSLILYHYCMCYRGLILLAKSSTLLGFFERLLDERSLSLQIYT